MACHELTKKRVLSIHKICTEDGRANPGRRDESAAILSNDPFAPFANAAASREAQYLCESFSFSLKFTAYW